MNTCYYLYQCFLSQTSFSLYLHNQWTDFHKLSCAGKPQIRANCTYVGCIKVATNNWDIRSVMGCFGHEQFLFSFIFWLYRDFVFFFFFFSFGQWRGTRQGSYMTGHMMWGHRPRTWWKDLEDDIRAYVGSMVALSRMWGKHEVKAWTIG